MKIFDSHGKELLDLPAKPRNFDGWAKGTTYGLEINGERLKLGVAENDEQARYRLKQLRRAYLDGAEIFTITEAPHD